jgi:hypothetical protein
MQMRRMLAPLVAALFAAGCSDDLDVTNPNQRTTDSFWRTESDAVAGVNAAYNMLQQGGVYGQWAWLALDGRTDINTSRSPWGELANFTRTVLITGDFVANREIWEQHYRGIYRANQVIANTPNVAAPDSTKARIAAEAKFVRAVLYYDLATLFGNVPIVTELPETASRPTTAPQAEVWAQALKDAQEAAPALPVRYEGNERGRATRGAALALAGRVQLQNKQWAAAAQTFGQVVALANAAGYALTPTFAENFTVAGDNNSEAVFEVGFGGPATLAQGTRGNFISRLVGPPGVGFTDVQPTDWYFQQFFVEGGANRPDPRLFHTAFYNRPGGMDVYGRPFADRYATGFREKGINETYFWKKHGEHYLTFQDDNSAINYKLIRYADVLLMHAEALNESGRPAEALAIVNQIRARANNNAAPGSVTLAPRPATSDQAQVRRWVEHEFLMELGWENHRLQYLKRHDMLTREALLPHDPDFAEWRNGQFELLPIPQTERDLNPGVQQNPGWQ